MVRVNIEFSPVSIVARGAGNRAEEAVGRTIAELRELVSGLKAVFLAFCT